MRGGILAGATMLALIFAVAGAPLGHSEGGSAPLPKPPPESEIARAKPALEATRHGRFADRLLAQTKANPPLSGVDLLAALRGGGYIIYFRHADTDWSQKDTPGMNFEDCPVQRNLADKGREHSRQIGAAIRALEIPIGSVLASPLCRTVETAVLAFGRADKAMAVVERRGAAGTPERYAALRALMSQPVATGGNTVIVGHAYPYYSLVGGQYLEEGEADVLRPRGTDFEVVARVGFKQWRELAAAAVGR